MDLETLKNKIEDFNDSIIMSFFIILLGADVLINLKNNQMDII